MTIPAISSLIASVGGKGTLSGMGDMLPEGGLPMDFAALLAGQFPLPGQTDPALLTTQASSNGQQPAIALLSGLTTPKNTVTVDTLLPVDIKLPFDIKPTAATETTKGRAEDILAALAPQPLTASATLPVSASAVATQITLVTTETDGRKKAKDGEPESESRSDAIPADLGTAAQYVIPQAIPPVQIRLPESSDRDESSLPALTVREDDARPDTHEGRQANLPQGGNPVLASVLQAPGIASAPGATSAPGITPTNATPASPIAQAPESTISQRAETANAAILAGDASNGISAGTPAFASALAASTAANASANTSPTQTPTVSSHINSPDWAHDFGTRVVWLAKNDQQTAQININPPQLGPVQISISLNGDFANTLFTSPHPEVRQAIQDALPQLREMLSSAGINLGQANVGAQLPQQNRDSSTQFSNKNRSEGENAILSTESLTGTTSAGLTAQKGRGLVDLFA